MVARLIFPVPWARRPDLSFLLTAEQMKAALAAAGFTELTWVDKTDGGHCLVRRAAIEISSRCAPPLGIHVLMGKEFAGMAANLGRNLREGRARLVQTIVKRR